MTQMLEQAFAEVAKLPDEEQDAFAAWIVEELEAEQRWAQPFAQSQDALTQLVEQALAECSTVCIQPINVR